MTRYSKQLIIAALIILNLINGYAQESTQRKQLFDDNWKFYLGDAKGASDINFNDEDWRMLDLPHDWSIEGKINPKNSMGAEGAFLPGGIGWYRKTFVVPVAMKGKQISVNFEGVYMNSEVFINGKSLGKRPYGYTDFVYEITPNINYGTQNIISVRVDNSMQTNSRWYTGSGIYRHVWLIATNPVHIANYGISVTTTDVSDTKANVEVKTLLKNETNQPQNIRLKTELSNSSKKNSGSYQIAVTLLANSEKQVVQNIVVAKPLLWSPETPNLYNALVQVLHKNESMDANKINFGIRAIKFTSEKGFQLNGKTIKLNGGCVHHDNGCLGAAAFDRAEERKVKNLKAAGFNAIRTAHNPPSIAFLNACDKLGMLVMDEAFDGWKAHKTPYDYSMYFEEWSKRDMETLVLRDRNHPSVIMWSIGNEIIERKSPEALEIAKKLISYIKKYDTSRPVTSGMTTWDKDWEIFDPLMAAHDVAGYNYQIHEAAKDHKRVPSRIIVQTESYSKEAFNNWKLVHNADYLIGDFVWTAHDYLGESGIGRWYYSGEATAGHNDAELFPWHGAYCGDVDLIGQRKPISHYRSMLYNTNESLYMAVREPEPKPLEIKVTQWAVWPTWESWTWPGYENKDMQVEVYSKYPKVRLYLNNKMIAEKSTTIDQEFKAVFDVPYVTGELMAVGIKDDKEVEKTYLKTAGNATKIKLSADRNRVVANGQDLTFIIVEVADESGLLQPNAENRLHFTIDGPGVIAGVDNANLKDIDPYVATSRKAWHGRALIVVKSTKNVGDIKLSVSSTGLADASVTIKSELAK